LIYDKSIEVSMLSKLLGHASEIDINTIKKDYGPILLDDEEIQIGFKVIRDIFIFTNKRLILVDRQGVTGKKVEYHTIPYKSITHFSTETAGTFDMDAELKIWVHGAVQPIERELRKGTNIVGLQKTLAHFVTR
jgi:hypothetical protein